MNYMLLKYFNIYGYKIYFINIKSKKIKITRLILEIQLFRLQFVCTYKIVFLYVINKKKKIISNVYLKLAHIFDYNPYFWSCRKNRRLLYQIYLGMLALQAQKKMIQFY